MKLVIAEKPSVAQSIAAVLGAREKKDGYLQGSNTIVSWCVGHLVELAPADSYNEKFAKWRYEDLPILPSPWHYVVPQEKQKQFQVLRSLMNDPRVDAVVCATDAGREGELIFRLVYNQCGCQKPVQRLWISSMEDSAIRTGFAALRDGSAYDGLYQSALCRAQADWLVGINATRLFSVLYCQTLNVGRVMSPTLAMVVGREAAIDAFKPEPFYSVVLDSGTFTAFSEKMKDCAAAESLRAACDGKAAMVLNIETKEKAEKPPKLYDLTTLQRDANRLLGFTAQQTLDYTQSLYEKKLVTYPRTDSRYLTSDMAESTPLLVNAAASVLPFLQQNTVACSLAQVIDDSQVSDHHAIIPTATMPKADLASLPAGDRDILCLITVRLICAVGEPCITDETLVTVDCGGKIFTAKGKTIRQNGWKAIDEQYRSTLKNKPDEKKEPAALPVLNEGQHLSPVAASIKEGKTSPPKHFTEDTLLSAMETAGAEEMPDDAERKGLGTPATRAGILEKLIKTELMERRGDKKTKYLLPTHKGISLITVLPELIQSPQLTAEWEERLKLVERGQLTADDFLADIKAMTSELVQTYQAVKGAAVLFPSDQESIGVCPRCGNPVIEGEKSFYCQNRACRFVLWKENGFFKDKKKVLTRQIAAVLLKEGRIKLTSLYSKKTGKTYDAMVVLDDTGDKYVNFRLEFERQGGKSHE